MIEAHWMASTRPSRMLNLLRVRRPDDSRKCRLLAAAFCRRIWDLLDDRARSAVGALERCAEGRSTGAEMAFHADQTQAATWDYTGSTGASHAAEAAANAVAWDGNKGTGPFITHIARVSSVAYHAAYARAASIDPGELGHAWQEAIRAEEAAQSDLVREVFGNVIRPVAVEPDWRTPGVVDLARAIAGSKDFGGMAALGDALEEAGCVRPEVLDHCRNPGDHVPGCWVLDTLIEAG